MDLLRAVNSILPALGEHVVTSIDNKHPTVNLIVANMELERRALLGRGWWFNTYRGKLYPDPGGIIALPNDALSVEAEGAVQGPGRRLVRIGTMDAVWDGPVEVILKLDRAYEDLPESAALYVLYAGLLRTYLTDIGREQIMEEWKVSRALAEGMLTEEHLRNMRYSTRRSRAYQNILRHVRGG